MNVCIVAGARPNFIKVAPLVKAINRATNAGKDISYVLVYTGAKDDETLEKTLFTDLGIKFPDVYLEATSNNLNELTGQVMQAFDSYLNKNKTDVVIVVDDLASTMAIAIVTKKHGIRLAHIVAGTRSFDINMPKEINRLVIDGLSDLLFTAGQRSSNIAVKEGAGISKVFMVGNILMDTLRDCYSRFVRPALLNKLNIADGKYIVFTLNRKLLISDENYISNLVHELIAADSKGITIIAPLRYPSAQKVKNVLEDSDYKFNNIHIIEPLSYLTFGYITAHALGIITDSGNVAEEATFNGIPCITLNDYTEHIETVNVGTNVLVGNDFSLYSKYLNDMINCHWKNSSLPECWDGRTADRIVSILLSC
jgi:UDP-N-acetylglucosamine 2-epimerase (non-hydrolysing)